MTTSDAERPGSGPGPYRIRYAALSDVGRHRKENQDSGYASEHLIAIADGVGGAAYGDVASATAIHLLRRLDQAPQGEMLPALAGVVHRIHDKLAEMVEQDRELEGTSTTVTAALFDGRQFGFVHVGDSRAYLLRQGQVRQITKDHTFVQTLVDEGRITEADSRVHPQRNVILRAVDATGDTEPDLFVLEAEVGDRVLVCSDGMSGVLDDNDVLPLLGADSVDAAAVALVQASLDAGTTDNVSVVVAEVVGVDDVDDEETSAAVTVGPMLVGAASSQPRRGGVLSRALFRQRPTTATDEADDMGDTGEIPPVEATSDDGAGAVDPEELRYAPRPPRRREGLRRAALVVLTVLVVAAALGGAYSWTQTQYYVAADGGQVAIYRGVQLDLPGLELSHPYETSDNVAVADLDELSRDKVADGIVADDLAHARRIVAELADQNERPSEDQNERPSEDPTEAPNGAGTGTARAAGPTLTAGTAG